jgi:PAS domain S-box-containing protein
LQQGAQDYLVKGQLDTGGFRRAVRYAVERKATEEAQRQTAESYRMLFDSNPQPMWVLDPESKAFLAANDAALRKFGYSREEFLGMTLCGILREGDTDDFEATLADHANRGVMPLGSAGAVKRRKKNGEVIEVEMARGPITFLGRSALLCVANDVTERNSLQAQLVRPQKMESLGRLAGGLAHDLNNLMGVVLLFGDLTLESLGGESPLRHNVERIQEAARQSISIVRQLLAFSRKQIQQPRMLSLNTVVTGMEELLRRLIGEDVQLLVDLDTDLGTVKADPGQIEQIIMNLVLNARDAMPEGGRLRIGTANAESDDTESGRESGSSIGPCVTLTVSDTGCGIDLATQARIFEPFFTTKEPGKGTGLGLSTAYGIVKQSGGSISVQSELGHGATFRICLPRVKGAPQPKISAKPAGHVPGGPETVLLVEDAEPLREVVREFLHRGGYNVLVAEGGAAALAASKNHHGAIDLLLTDVVMPGLSGRQIAEELHTARPGMRVLFMSGYTGEALGRHRVIEEGIALLEKPFTRTALLRKLRDVLDPVASSLQGELQ